jgi:hypothetical protein
MPIKLSEAAYIMTIETLVLGLKYLFKNVRIK